MATRFKEWFRYSWPALIVVLVGVLIQAFLVDHSLFYYLTNLLPDDAFFYFTLARNIVHGLGATFDGVNPTNAFHPLWLLILVAIFKLTGTTAVGATVPVRAALILSVVMNAITALLITRILARFTSSCWIAAFGTLVWMLNPFLLYETLNGLETSLSLLFFALFFLFALRLEEKPSVRSYVVLGFVGSLMVLARLDMAVYAAAFLIWTFMRNGWREGSKNTVFFCLGGILVLGWIIWNWINFHMIMTSASDLETLIEHQIIVQDHGNSLFQFLKAIVYNTQLIGDAAFQLTGVFTILFGFIGAGIVLLARGRLTFPQRLKDVSVAFALFLGFVALFVANASIRWSDRTWYFVSGEAFVAILVVLVLERFMTQIRYVRIVAIVLVGLTLFSFYVDWSKNLAPGKNTFATQVQMYDTALWMNANFPPGTVVGTFTPGVDGYFSTLAPIDLDGVANNASLQAIKNRQLWQYIVDNHVQYISDYGAGLSYRYKSFLGIDDVFSHLTLVEDMFHDPGAVRIYKVND